MIAALLLALGDLADARILGVLLRSIVVSLLLFAGLGVLAGWALTGSDPCGWLDLGSCTLGVSGGGFGAFVLTLLAIWFLFPAIALGVVTAYMDRVMAAVELRHYPAAALQSPPLGMVRGGLLGLGSGLRVLLYNLIAAPFYLLLLVTGIGPLLLFLAVNGLAFGQDLGAMITARHTGPDRRAWLRATRSDRFLLGAAMTGLFLIPFVNLLAPVLGAAATAHLYHRR